MRSHFGGCRIQGLGVRGQGLGISDFYQPKDFGKPKDFVEFGTANLDSQELKKSVTTRVHHLTPNP